MDYDEAKRHHLTEYNAQGTELARFDDGEEDPLHGLAYGDAAGELYLLSTNGNLTPPVARVRMVAPPRVTDSVFFGFRISPSLGW